MIVVTPDLDELKWLDAERTPGPWAVVLETDDPEPAIMAGEIYIATAHHRGLEVPRELTDAEYIVAACNAVPQLVAEIERLKEQLPHG